jgi:hypothetical protein
MKYFMRLYYPYVIPIVLIINILLITACNQGKKPSQQEIEPEEQTEEAYFISEEELIFKPKTGIYYGFLPCPDCPRIIMQIQLNRDGTYWTYINYQKEGLYPVREKGRYRFMNETDIVLLRAVEELNYFRVRPEGLLLLDSQGKRHQTDDPSSYLLRRIDNENTGKSELLLEIADSKAEMDFDFYAIGSEPQWNLDLDFDKQFRFITMDGLKLTFPASEGAVSEDGLTTTLMSSSEMGEMQVFITEQPCMEFGEEIFDYKVEIKLKTPQAKYFTNYDGCGNYIEPMQ